ncbi:hypothetical protein ACPA9J_04085 [Pseudomonas aeruginosa]
MTYVEAGRGAPLRGGGRHQRGREVDLSAALAARLGCTHVELGPTLLGPRLAKPCPTNASSTPWSGRRRRRAGSPTATTAPSASCSGAAPPTWYGWNFGRWTVFSGSFAAPWPGAAAHPPVPRQP